MGPALQIYVQVFQAYTLKLLLIPDILSTFYVLNLPVST